MQAEKKVFQVQIFQGVEHGFALRGNVENGYERELASTAEDSEVLAANVTIGYTKEQSLKGIAEWFDFWLSKDAATGAKL